MGQKTLFRCLMISCAGFLTTANLAPAKSFTGIFHGTNHQCIGGLYIRTKTIEWHTPIYACRSTYKVIYQNLHTPFQDKDRIDFKLDHVSAGCPFPYLSFYYLNNPKEPPSDPTKIFSNWALAAFKSYGAYKDFSAQDFFTIPMPIPMSYMTCSDFLYGPTINRPDGVATFK